LEKFIIDEEFGHLLPALGKETYRRLEEDIIENGCVTPLVVWNGILIDGYNRYRICKEHDIPFTTVCKDFRTRQDARKWIIDNQVSRRNLTSLQLSHHIKPVTLLRPAGIKQRVLVMPQPEDTESCPAVSSPVNKPELDIMLRRLSSDFSSIMHMMNNASNTSKLRAALRIYIKNLETLYMQI